MARIGDEEMKDFDASLTEEEKKSKTFLEWPDATIARCVRATAKLLKDEKGNKGIFIQAALEVISSVMYEANAETMNLETKGDYKGKDYKLVVKCKLTNSQPTLGN